MLYGATEKTLKEISQKLSNIQAGSDGASGGASENVPMVGNGASLIGATEATLLEISQKLSDIQASGGGSGAPGTSAAVTAESIEDALG